MDNKSISGINLDVPAFADVDVSALDKKLKTIAELQKQLSELSAMKVFSIDDENKLMEKLANYKKGELFLIGKLNETHDKHGANIKPLLEKVIALETQRDTEKKPFADEISVMRMRISEIETAIGKKSVIANADANTPKETVNSSISTWADYKTQKDGKIAKAIVAIVELGKTYGDVFGEKKSGYGDLAMLREKKIIKCTSNGDKGCAIDTQATYALA